MRTEAMANGWTGPTEKVGPYKWIIPRSYKEGMRVDGVIYADDRLMKSILRDRGPEQVANVAFLPGIQKASFAMPDIHWGYGFCIGGVAATDPAQGGVVSPGGVGYDINCGVRLLRTSLEESDVRPRLSELIPLLFSNIPAGVGRSGALSFRRKEVQKILEDGSRWIVKQGYGRPEDLECTEAGGAIEGADPGKVSDRAFQRGSNQVGTLGSGNHFLEVQVVDEIYDKDCAEVFGLSKGQVTVMIHCGSRGLGHQVCDDSLRALRNAPKKYGIELPDRQLVCAPVESPEGRAYLGAMRSAANYAWANRQVLTHLVRRLFTRFFGIGEGKLDMGLIYDVAHNIANLERYKVEGVEKTLCVHRKGATRAFPPGHPEIPDRYRRIGQPIIIPGDMGSYSYLLVGTEKAMEETFGSTCHGAGRVMSRGAAIRAAKGRSISKELAQKGIIAMARGRTGLAEEQPDAYKDVNVVVDVVDGVGISRKVCRMRPMGVIKG